MDNTATARPQSRTDALIDGIGKAVSQLAERLNPILVNEEIKETSDKPMQAESTQLNRQLAEIERGLKGILSKISI